MSKKFKFPTKFPAIDPKKIDPWTVVGLRVRKGSSDYLYGGFHRRMMAVTIDSFIALILLAPLVDQLVTASVGPVTMEGGQEIVSNIQLLADANHAPPEQRAQMIDQFLQSISFSSWLQGTLIQSFALLAVTLLCWLYWSATPGKILLRMKIVDARTRGPISRTQALLRAFGYIISTLPLGLGFFWMSLNKKRQGWHDILAGTLVVRIHREDKKPQPETESSATP
jgi:uncharacterized RDD family membrane protein YckC